jgi:hypothetical protein
MPNTDALNSSIADRERLLDEWLSRLTALVESLQKWAEEFGWSTRRIEKQMEDSQIGVYRAPALILQEASVRVLLEPIARSAPGAEGVVDLYLMPAYDDIASLYYCDGGWQLHYMFSGTPSVATIREAKSKPLFKETFQEVLEQMRRNAA